MTLGAPGLLLAGAAGLACGSYAVTAGLRFARGESATFGRSRCDGCGRVLGFHQMVPILSYVGLRGACRACGARIDPLHLAGEAAGALIAVSAFGVAEPARAPILALMGLLLIAAAAVDAKVQRLPDVFVAAVALCCAALAIGAGPAQVLEGLVAAAAATAVLLGLRAGFAHRGGDPGLGLGDVKLLAALSLWLGVATPLMIALAAGLGLLAAALRRRPDRRIAFGPAIALAAWPLGLALEGGWRP